MQLVVSVLMLGASVWIYTTIYDCPVDAWDCEGWIYLTLYFLVPPALLFLGSSITYLKVRSNYAFVAPFIAGIWIYVLGFSDLIT